MRARDSELIFSPTDLCNYVESPFASWMDHHALDTPGRFTPDPPTEDNELVLRKGREREDRYLEALIAKGQAPFDTRDERDRRRATVEAMRRGVIALKDVIYFVTVASLCLAIAFRSLESRRWS